MTRPRCPDCGSALSAVGCAFCALVRGCRALALPAPEAEHCFAPPRRWRFDVAWPASRVAVEIEGGLFARGRHNRPLGYMADMEKYNQATVLGWRVLRYTPEQIVACDWVDDARAVLKGEER